MHGTKEDQIFSVDFYFDSIYKTNKILQCLKYRFRDATLAAENTRDKGVLDTINSVSGPIERLIGLSIRAKAEEN